MAALLGGAMATHGASHSFESGATRVAVLELYTSEGCSSCPPADAWLSRLTNSSGLWRDFVPVAFHVQYWDRLGWRDRFGDPRSAERQSAYARALGSESVYTPEFVLNGAEWRAWWQHTSPPPATRQRAGLLRAYSADGARWRIEFQSASESRDRFEAFVALLESGLASNVKAGENSGRQLAHDFVVRQIESAALSPAQAVHSAELELKAPAQPVTGRKAVAIWVTMKGKLQPVQATGGWLGKLDQINGRGSP